MTRQIKKRETRGTGRRKAKKPTPTYTVEDLLEQAAQAIASVQLEEAVDLYQQALQIQPTNTNIMDALADLYLQTGDPVSALNLLRQSITLEPETNGVKWMFLAQLIGGKESLEAYKKGIELLLRSLQGTQDVQQVDSTKKTLGGAFCGVADLFMTDLCFEENAEQFCEEAVNNAIFYHRNVDALQTLASLRISQCRKSDACDVLETIYQEFIKSALENFRKRTLMDEMQEDDEEDISDSLPGPECIVALIKLYMECSCAERTNFYDYAHELLEYVLDLDNENPDLWYLMGINANSRSPCDEETAEDAFNTAKSMLESYLEQDPDLENAKCLLDDVNIALQHIGKPIPLRPQTTNTSQDDSNGRIASVFNVANTSQQAMEEWSDDEN